MTGSTVLLLGLAYKPDVGDTRDSPAYDVAKLLDARGARVIYHDPFVPTAMLNGRKARSVRLSAALIARSQCVVLLTNHSTVDYALILKHAQVIVDTRNQYAGARRNRRVVPL